MNEIQAIINSLQQTLALLTQIAQDVGTLAGRAGAEHSGVVPVAVAAKRLGLHPRTLIIKLKTKEIPGCRIGRRWFVKMDELCAR